MSISEVLQTTWWVRQLAASAVLVAFVACLRWFLAVRLKRSAIRSPDLHRRWQAQLRNASFFLLLIGLFAIWSTELQALAISMVAIVVGIVLATKELILCLTGSLLKARSGAFAIGDRIEIGSTRGDVVDQTLLTTRLAEVGSGSTAHKYTGRSVTIPNSLFLSLPLANESVLGGFVFRSLTVEVPAGDGWQAAEERLLAAAHEETAPMLEEARDGLIRRANREGMESMTVEPKVTVAMPSADRIQLILRFPTPLEQALDMEQQILRRYLEA